MGLSALLGGTGEADALRADGGAGGMPRTVPIEFLRPSPHQPRRRFDGEELAALADSVRARGVLQPLLVRRREGEGAEPYYEIVAGERRWRAAQAAGLHELPVVVHELSDRDALELALVENVQRQDLTPLEEAEGYRRLVDEFGHTQEVLARALGRSRSHVANTLRLLNLPKPVREMVEDGRLTAGHARALLGSHDPTAVARDVVARALNVRQTEALMRRRGTRPAAAAASRRPDPDLAALERTLSQRLGLRVRLRSRGRGGGGTLEIGFSSPEQLDGLLRRLR